MTVVRKHIVTETAHRLVDYTGKCARIHGHSYRWEVEITAPVKKNGISMDFSHLKELLVRQIHVPYDHKLILSKDDPLVDVLWQVNQGEHLTTVPFNPTAENLAKAAAQSIINFLEAEQWLISLTCWETENSYAKYVP
jgi:6-pyruvoyltetrahydropterin/6-carboxytetrahydropterin synthase